MRKLISSAAFLVLGVGAASTAQAQIALKGSDTTPSVTLNNKTEITVTSPDPASAGKEVAAQQTRVNGDMVRNAGTAIR